MDHIHVTIYNATLYPHTVGAYYVKLFWNNVKYKTKSAAFNLRYDEDFMLPLTENTKGEDKLRVELWKSGIFNYRIGGTYIKFKDIKKNKYASKKVKMSCFPNQITITLSAHVKRRSDDYLLNKMIRMFPTVPREHTQHIIKIYKTENVIIEQLFKISNPSNYANNNIGNPLTQNPYYANNMNNITPYNMAGTNMGNCATLGMSPVLQSGNDFFPGNPTGGVMTINMANAPMYSPNSFSVGAPSPYADRYIYRTSENKKKALLIGVNYYGSKHELTGCVNDTLRMKNLLITKYGFHDSPLCMLRLIDNEVNLDYRPTKKNILSALTWLTTDNKKGDVLFFLFSGRGSKQRDLKNIEEDGYNETILPCDFKTEGEIIDDDLHRYLIQPLCNGVKLIAVMDCCYAGTCLDLSYEYLINKRAWREIKNPFHVICDVSQFGSCRDAGVAYEVDNKKNAPGGSLVNAMVQVLSNIECAVTYEYVLNAVDNLVVQANKNQHISFMSSQVFSISNRLFDFENIMENKNVNLGQILNYVGATKRK